MHAQAFMLPSQPTDTSIPITGRQEAGQGCLLLDSTGLAGTQHSTSIGLPCHTNVVKPAPQQDLPSSQYAVNTSRHLLAVEQAPDRTSEYDTATDLTSTTPHINSRHASDPKMDDMPTQDVYSIDDAADQQALQHGAGALGTNREFHRQLGQRFDKSAADHGSAQNVATSGQIPPEQSEITPGSG